MNQTVVSWCNQTHAVFELLNVHGGTCSTQTTAVFNLLCSTLRTLCLRAELLSLFVVKRLKTYTVKMLKCTYLHWKSSWCLAFSCAVFSCPAFSCPAFSCPAFSCLAFSCPATWSVIFTSCNFMPATWSVIFMACNCMPCNFDGPSFSCPSFSVNPMWRWFLWWSADEVVRMNVDSWTSLWRLRSCSSVFVKTKAYISCARSVCCTAVSRDQ